MILKYGIPFERLEKILTSWSPQVAIRWTTITDYELEQLIGELCRSFNHEACGKHEDAVSDLIEGLEYVERTGDGEIDMR